MTSPRPRAETWKIISLQAHDLAAETAALALLTPEAVRERTAMVFAAVEAGTSDHFALRPERMAETAYASSRMKALEGEAGSEALADDFHVDDRA